MSEEKRRLAAIMFTDLVGYSALSQKNEALALELLDEKRILIEQHLDQFDGQVIKSTGDGFLIEFGSAIQAVNYANEVQQAMAARNKEVDPERLFEIRIGIHLGDVLYKDGDVLGDGVNIAARIEPLARPGGISISEQVYDQVHNKIPLGFQSLGTPEMKNIEAPIEVFHVLAPGEAGSSETTGATHKQNRRASRENAKKQFPFWIFIPIIAVIGFAFFILQNNFATSNSINTGPVSISAIAVLPMENLSANEEDEYFSDGMTEEILNVLTQLDGIRVISRTSVFQLKGSDLELAAIGERLNVDHVVEGSVRRAGDQVRINIKLVDVANDQTIWSESYERKMENVFQIQDEIARDISDRIEVELSGSDIAAGGDSATEAVDPEAYELYLKGRFFWNKRNFEGFHRARLNFELASDADPTFAQAYAGLADTYSLMAEYGYMRPEIAYPQAKEAAEKALELDENLAEAVASLAIIYTDYEEIKDLERAEELFLQAIELNPNYASAHQWYSSLLLETDRADESLEQAEIALRLDPLSAIINVAVGDRYLRREEYETAEKYYEQALELDPLFVSGRLGLAQLNAQRQDFAAAESQVEASARENPNDLRVQLNLAVTKMHVWKWDEAEAAFQRAISIEEGELLRATAQLQYAVYLGLMGRAAEALDQVDQALAITPDNLNLTAVRTLYEGQLLFTNRDDNLINRMAEIASDSSLDAINVATAKLFQAFGLSQVGGYDEALQLLDEAERVFNLRNPEEDLFARALLRSSFSFRGMIHALKGEREEAEAVLDELIGLKDTTGVPYNIAVIYFYLDEIEEAFQWLQVGVTQHDFSTASMATNYILDPLREDPRFEDLLNQMNLGSESQD